MRDDRVLIICVCAIICMVVISAAAIIITDNQKEAANQTQNTTTVQQTNDSGSNQASSGSNSASSGSQATQATTTNSFPSVKSATFYSDGNPNTGESATINVGSEHAGETIYVAIWYYRDGSPMNNPSSQALTVGQDGTVSHTDYTAMPKYPDEAEVEISDGNTVDTKTFSLGKYKGSQTKYA